MRLLVVTVVVAGALTVSAPRAGADPAPARAGSGLSPNVVGGADTANPGWIVALLRADEADGFLAQFCGGSLIADDVVLTAAHCVDDLSPAELDVAIGVTVLSDIEAGDRREIASIAVHPQWAIDETVDLALLHLGRPTGATPVSVETSADQPDGGRPLVIRGWGATTPARTGYADVLQTAGVISLSSVSTSPSVTFPGCLVNDPGDDFCYGGATTGGCNGDSGGPLTGETSPGSDVVEVVGVVSFGPATQCLDPGILDAGQRVSPYRSWLAATMTAWSPSPPRPPTPPTPPTPPSVGGLACRRDGAPFVDTAASFAKGDIACVHDLGVANGVTSTLFVPGGNVTREQMAAFLARTARALGAACPAGATPFADIAGSFARTHIACIHGLGIANGTTTRTFDPGGLVTREQMAAFLARTVWAVGGICPTAAAPFVDLAGSFARGDVACVHGLGIANGTTPSTFDPGGFVTREQMAAFLARTLT